MLQLYLFYTSAYKPALQILCLYTPKLNIFTDEQTKCGDKTLQRQRLVETNRKNMCKTLNVNNN